MHQVRNRFRGIPFILFTGVSREELLIEALNAGANYFLQKGGEIAPHNAEIIHAINQAVLRRKLE